MERIKKLICDYLVLTPIAKKEMSEYFYFLKQKENYYKYPNITQIVDKKLSNYYEKIEAFIQRQDKNIKKELAQNGIVLRDLIVLLIKEIKEIK